MRLKSRETLVRPKEAMSVMRRIRRNIGFGERRFLTEAEWLTYLRRMPVRYIRSPKQERCQYPGCRFGGLAGDASNPLQNAHVIGFGVGVVYLALTPDYLDSAENIVTAHRKTCNKGLELGLREAMA